MCKVAAAVQKSREEAGQQTEGLPVAGPSPAGGVVGLVRKGAFPQAPAPNSLFCTPQAEGLVPTEPWNGEPHLP